MGETKYIRLTVRFARQKGIHDEKVINDAIYHGFRPGVETHKCSNGPDRNSVTVEVNGDVDAGKLYDCLKKIGSSVEIESVIPKKMMDLEEDLKSENQTTRKTNQRLRSEINSLKEDKKRLLSENKSLDEDNKRRLSENKSLDEDNKKLRRKINDLKENNERGTSDTSAALQAIDKSIIMADHKHDIKQLMEDIVHLNSKISKLEKKNMISEDGRRDKETEVEQLKEQLRQLIT